MHEETFSNDNTDENEDDVDEETFSEDEPECYKFLYDGCHICEDQSILLVSLFASRHRLSDVAVKDLLKLIPVFIYLFPTISQSQCSGN